MVSSLRSLSCAATNQGWRLEDFIDFNPTEAGDAELRELSERVARRSALRQSYRQSSDGLERSSATHAGITTALADDLWLAEVELRADRSLRVAGHALQAASLQGFAARLQQSPVPRGVPLYSLAIERVDAESRDDSTPTRLRFVIQAGAAIRGCRSPAGPQRRPQ